MTSRDRSDRFFLWSMFILPAVTGTLSWMVRDRFEPGVGLLVAIAGWGVRTPLRPVDHLRALPETTRQPVGRQGRATERGSNT